MYRRILLSIFVSFFLSTPAHAALVIDNYRYAAAGGGGADCSGTPAYYWIDDGDATGTWDNSNTANWSTSSGGSGGAGPPTSSDDVCFDSNSGSGTATISSTSASRNVEVANFTGTISHPSSTTWTISGGLIFDTEFTYTKGNSSSSATTFNAASGSYNINTSGKTLGQVIFNGANPTWTLTGTFDSSSLVTLTDGNFDTNDQTVNILTFNSSNSNSRSIDFGASTINLSSNSFTIATSTNLTLDAGTSSIVMSHANPTFSGSGKTFYDVTFTGAGTVNLVGGNTYHNLTRTVSSGSTAELIFNGNPTVTGTLTITGNSKTERIYVGSNVRGTTRTITAANLSVNAADFEDITGAGAGSWDLSASSNYVGLCGGTSSITGTTPETLYWVGNGGNFSDTAHWSTSSGGASGARSPICSDTATIDANSFSSGSQTLTLDRARLPGLNGSAVTNNPTLASASATTVYGDFNWGSTTTMTGSGDWTLAGRSSQSINVAATLGSAMDINVDAPGGTYTQNGTLTGASNTSLTLTQGTLDLNDQNLTVGTVNINGALSRTLSMGSGTITITNGSTAWNSVATTNLTFNSETSTINIAGTGTQAFSGGGLTFYNLTWASSTGTKTLNNSNTFNNLTLTAPLSTFRFNANTTQTINGAVNCTGTAGNTISWTSTSVTNATVSKASGSVDCDYITINDITATGGATFNATNATCSDATGWSCSP